MSSTAFFATGDSVAEAVSAGLREAAISGARWTFPARLSRELVAFVASVVLAHLISPAEFGHVAVALIVVALTAILGTAGITAPLVQRAELTRRATGAAVVLCLAVGALSMLVTIGVAEAIVRPLFSSRTAELVLLASPAWLLVAVGAPSYALLHRGFQFRTIAAAETSAAVLGAGTSVSLAAIGVNGGAVVVGSLVFVGVTGAVAFVAMPPGASRPDRKSLRETVTFAGPLAASSLVYIAYRNVDYVILGARATATNVGLYWRAWQLGVSYPSRITDIMQWVSLPVFSRASDHNELRAIHARIVRTHATALIPLLAAFIGVAPVLVPWLFGATWEPAVVPAQLMAVAGMGEVVLAGVGPLMVALGRPAVLLRVNLAFLALFASMIFVLAPYRLEIVATGVACFGVATVFITQLVVRRPYAGLTFGDLWSETQPGIVTGAAVLVVSFGAREALVRTGTPSAFVLLLACTASALAFALLLKTLFPRAWDDLRAILRALRRDTEPNG